MAQRRTICPDCQKVCRARGSRGMCLTALLPCPRLFSHHLRALSTVVNKYTFLLPSFSLAPDTGGSPKSCLCIFLFTALLSLHQSLPFYASDSLSHNPRTERLQQPTEVKRRHDEYWDLSRRCKLTHTARRQPSACHIDTLSHFLCWRMKGSDC